MKRKKKGKGKYKKKRGRKGNTLKRSGAFG